MNMEVIRVLRLLGKALPVIIANGPVIVETVRQIREALRKPPTSQPVPGGPVPAALAE
jgi:hypothetical protein